MKYLPLDNIKGGRNYLLIDFRLNEPPYIEPVILTGSSLEQLMFTGSGKYTRAVQMTRYIEYYGDFDKGWILKNLV